MSVACNSNRFQGLQSWDAHRLLVIWREFHALQLLCSALMLHTADEE